MQILDTAVQRLWQKEVGSEEVDRVTEGFRVQCNDVNWREGEATGLLNDTRGTCHTEIVGLGEHPDAFVDYGVGRITDALFDEVDVDLLGLCGYKSSGWVRMSESCDGLDVAKRS